VKQALLWFALVLGCAQGALGQQGQALVTVYADREDGPVNRLLLGASQLAWHDGSDLYRRYGAGIWDPDTRRPAPEYVAAAEACGLSLSRWPGGCAAHTLNWKETVGPADRRPKQAFGLPEFLTWCRETHSVPLIAIGAFAGTEKDAADLVEYLNAPNNGSNPNGGTDWAAVRAADGHVPPHNVVWFEYDSTAYHGDDSPATGGKPRLRLSPERYAQRYLETRRAMRAVDAKVKLGAAVPLEVDTWNRVVLEEAGEHLDFAVTELLLPRWQGDASPEQSTLLLQASLAAGAQVEAVWERANAMVEEVCGRTDLPWVVTDWGDLYVQEKPVPYRHALAAALGHAEQLRVMMDPRHRIAMAAYRQFANQDWGMIQGYPHRREPLRPQAAALACELYARHFGDTRLVATVAGDHWDFAGAAAVWPRSNGPRPQTEESAERLTKSSAWVIESLPEVPQSIKGTLLAVEFPGKDLDFRHASLRLSAKPDTWYRVRAMLKTEGLTGATGACLEIGDGRSGAAAKPSAFSHDVVGSSDWTEVTVDYRAPADAENLVITARRRTLEGGAGPVSGKALYRLLSVREVVFPNYGAVPDVTANAARRKDGVVTVVLVNTNPERDQSVTLALSGATVKPTSQARAWLMTGQAPWANNLGREDGVRVWMPSPARVDSTWTLNLPRHSLAAVEISL